ncbi:hypothetical protein HK104_006687 [Borealophlyctis nickersoniae]|nr:hypothetical protein HK104_006687 [Borealophlyctis nickersoniae]
MKCLFPDVAIQLTPSQSFNTTVTVVLTAPEQEDYFIYETTITGNNNSNSNPMGPEHYLGDIFDIRSQNLTIDGSDEWIISFRPKPSLPLARTSKKPPILRVFLSDYSASLMMNVFDPAPGVDMLDPDVLRDWLESHGNDLAAGFVLVPNNATLAADLQLEVTRKKGSPWTDIMFGPLAKLMKVPDPSRKWIIKQNANVPAPSGNGNLLLLQGPVSPVTVYEETLTIPFNNVVNSILSPAAVVLAIVAVLFGRGRYRPYGYAHTWWYFRRQAKHGADSERFKIYPTTNVEYPTHNAGLDERVKGLEDRMKACEELRELLIAEFVDVHRLQANVGNDGKEKTGYSSVV